MVPLHAWHFNDVSLMAECKEIYHCMVLQLCYTICFDVCSFYVHIMVIAVIMALTRSRVQIPATVFLLQAPD